MYRPSIYNHFVRYNDQVLSFNALSLSSFLMSTDEYRKIKAQFADPITFELGLPSVFTKFRDLGFLVEEGVDEMGAVRQRHMAQVYNNSKAHIMINLSNPKRGLTTVERRREFVKTLQKHIVVKISNSETKELCLEWHAKDNKLSKNIIVPINEFAKNECATHGVDFSTQIDVKALKTDSHTTNPPQAIWVDVAIIKRTDGHLSDGISFEQWRKYASSIESILKISPTTHIQLNVYAAPRSQDNLIDKIKSSIPSSIADNISINIFSVQNNGSIKAEWTSISTQVPQDKQWQKINEHCANHYSINTNGELFFGRYVNEDRSRLIGKIDQEGNAIYDVLKQGHYYNIAWFENERCAQCRYLPLLSSICELKTTYYGNARNVDCPVTSKGLCPDSLIVRFFKNKQSTI